MALIFSSSKDMTHNRVLQCLLVIGFHFHVCLCVCVGKMVQQEQGWCQSGNNGGNCPLCRGGILGNNGGIALVVGILVVGTQWVLPTHLLQDSQLLKYGDVTDSGRKGGAGYKLE